MEDVPLLIDYFISFLNDGLGRDIVTAGIEEQALRAMSQYQWPGNVRELANAVESAMTFGSDVLIRSEDLPAPISRIEPLRRASPRPSAPASGLGTFADVERDLISRALEACEWNKGPRRCNAEDFPQEALRKDQ